MHGCSQTAFFLGMVAATPPLLLGMLAAKPPLLLGMIAAKPSHYLFCFETKEVVWCRFERGWGECRAASDEGL